MASRKSNLTANGLTGFLFGAALAAAAMPAFAQASQKVVVVKSTDLAQIAARTAATQDKATPPRPQVISPIISADSYTFNLESHVGKGPGSLHPNWVEYIIVLQGTGNIATGGTVVEPATNADGNIHGTDLAGGTPNHVVAGDLMIVPQGVAHILIGDPDSRMVVATLHVPRNVVSAASDPLKLIHHASDLPAMITRARTAKAGTGDALLSLPPLRVEMQSASAKGSAVQHKNSGVFLYVLEGEGDLVTDGVLAHPRDMGADVSGDSIQGGNDNQVKKGDFIYVPKNVPYLAKADGTFVLASLQVPAP